jgi:hypothetical protein
MTLKEQSEKIENAVKEFMETRRFCRGKFVNYTDRDQQKLELVCNNNDIPVHVVKKIIFE